MPINITTQPLWLSVVLAAAGALHAAGCSCGETGPASPGDSIVGADADSPPLREVVESDLQDGDTADSASPALGCASGPSACAGLACLASDSGYVCSLPKPSCAGGWCLVPEALALVGDASDIAWDPYIERDEATTVTVGPLLMQQHAVTQADWMDMYPADPNPSRFAACGGSCPATGMTVAAVFAYANALSARDGIEKCYDLEGCTNPDVAADLECAGIVARGPSCAGYRLPTDSEWDFAARAGATTCFPGMTLSGDDGVTCLPSHELTKYGWFCANSGVEYAGCRDCLSKSTGDEPPPSACCGPKAVGQLLPNPLGLYDMYGNVWELTETPGATATPAADGLSEVTDSVEAKGGNFAWYPREACAPYSIKVGLGIEHVELGSVGFRLVKSTTQENGED